MKDKLAIDDVSFDSRNNTGYTNHFDWAIDRNMAWIVENVEEKISSALGMTAQGPNHLSVLHINRLSCSKPWVANEFLDALACYNNTEYGLDKLTLRNFKKKCEPFSEEVVSRLANMCPRLTHLRINYM